MQSASHVEELPRSRHALQIVFATVFELDSGSDNKILDGARGQELTGARESSNSLPDHHCHPRHIELSELDLTGVATGAKLQVQPRGPIANGLCARVALPGPSKVSRVPSSVVLTNRPPNRSTSCSTMA